MLDIDTRYYTTTRYGYGIRQTGINPTWKAKPNGFSKLQIEGRITQ